MSCDHKLIQENLTDFLEGKLAPELEARCESIIAACPHCAETCTKAQRLYRLGEQWRERQVPDWHRTAYAVKPPVREASWLSWGAMATSCLAILLVVFRLEVTTGNGLTISFGGGQAQQHMEQALAKAITQYQQQQDSVLAVRLEEFASQQELNNQLLLSEWSDLNRRERRDDLNFIMSAWETQRFQDQRQISRRFDTLASSQIESDQFINDLARNVNYTQRGLTP